MPVKNEQDLRNFAQQAAQLAEQIHQDWGSAVEGGRQVRTNIMLPTHGPDEKLLNVERMLGSVVRAIDDYLWNPQPQPAESACDWCKGQGTRDGEPCPVCGGRIRVPD